MPQTQVISGQGVVRILCINTILYLSCIGQHSIISTFSQQCDLKIMYMVIDVGSQTSFFAQSSYCKQTQITQLPVDISDSQLDTASKWM